jgi:hypothetical protein
MQTDGSHETYTGLLKTVAMRAFLDGYALKEPLAEANQPSHTSPFCSTCHETLLLSCLL